MQSKLRLVLFLVALALSSCSHKALKTSQSQESPSCENRQVVQYGYAGIGWGGPGMATAFYR